MDLGPRARGAFADYLDTFARQLREQGFERRVIGQQVLVGAKFSRWLQAEHVAAEALTDEHARRFLKEFEYRQRARQGAAATLQRLIDVLRQLGVCGAPTTISEPTPIERIVAAFADHLRNDQGLSARTLAQYCPFAKSFLSERFGIGPVDLATLRGLDVIQFVQRQAARVSPARAKAATIALRSFLRYVRSCGETRFNLAAAVPTVPNWSMTDIPRAMAPEHLRAVIANCPRHTPIGRRDYAILLLLARLGLRSCEIVTLTLDSIDWDAGSIAVAGKGNQAAVLPLPADVGEAIAEYLRSGRPVSNCRALFLRDCAPIRELGAPQTIATIVGTAISRAGVETRSRGAHQFRHALASDLLRRGATLTEIGSLLRHRHPKTTCIYAKVDFAALRPLGLPWPGDLA